MKWAFAGSTTAVAAMAYSDYSAYALVVERPELRLPKWSADGLRVAVLSDVHVNHDNATRRARESVQLAIAEKPDILVVTGDFVNSSRDHALANIQSAFQDLAGVSFPCVAVMGNHDYWTDQPRKIMDAVRQTPLKLLINETFEHRGVTIAGFDDAIGGHPGYQAFPEGSVSTNLIALLHEPDFVSDMPDHVSLQISGHSHGGQMCLPFGVILHTPRGAKKYRVGFYGDAKVPLYVTRGVGTVGPDLRLFSRPEVSLLTLRGA
ncbi:MAG: metallophosphoesterase [Fimbriimonadaceae bacterium]